MFKLAKYLLATTLVLGQLTACQPATGNGPSTPDGLRTLSAPSSAELSQLRDSDLPEANTRFSFKLFQDLLAQTPRENLFLSPLSLSIALSMLYNGASGQTQQEIAQALAYQGLSAEAINQGNLTLRKRLQNTGNGVEILIANALWGKEGLQFKSAFQSQNKAFYDAQLELLNFGTPAAVARINKWASDNTRGLIPKVVEQIDPQTILLLMNAIYFKGNWSDPFEASNTKPQTFHKADGTSLEHPMMSRYAKWRYAHNSEQGFQVASLPYGEDERTEMLVFLPDPGKSLEQWSEQLNEANWNSWLSSLRSREGRVVLPKFKLKTMLNLNDNLRRLGMSKAFLDGEAELDQLLESSGLRPFVSQVKQDAYVDVNEKGTEAAAVTTVTVGATSVQLPQEPFELVLDRPFAYLIYDRETQSILFMGALNQPQL